MNSGSNSSYQIYMNLFFSSSSFIPFFLFFIEHYNSQSLQSAAFDTIDHGTLIECLSSWFGVGGVVLNWFKSYLCDRYQCIKIGSVLSDAKRLLYGAGQSPGADLVLIIHYPPQ